MGEALTRLLHERPRLKLIATSCVPLRVPFETPFVLEPLALPDLEGVLAPKTALEAPAVAFFVFRRSAGRPGVRPHRRQRIESG